jgi:heptosyltransferase-2
MTFHPERCLVVGPSWVGDMVMAQSLFIVLKKRFPELQIDVLAPAWSRPLLERMPEVSNAIDMPLGHGALQLGTRYRLGKSLRQKNYDWAIVLPNSLKSALIPFWAHAKRRTGYTGEQRYGLFNDRRHLDKSVLTKTVQRFVALGFEAGAALPPECPNPELTIETENQNALFNKFGLENEKGVVALAPGAEYGPAKRWPAEYFSVVAEKLIDQGKQVVVVGSDKDAEISAKICSQSEALDLAGKTSLGEVIDLLSYCEITVSNDSGLMHVAAATGSNVVAIYGSSDPGFTPPMTSSARIINLGLDCSPCFKRECPLGHTNCLVKLGPDMVMDAIKRVSA